MRNRGALALIELALMLLVFALAAVFCLRAFVWADTASKEMEARDAALIRVQNAAEVLKSRGGDMAHAQTAGAELLGGQVEQGLWYILYDENWNPVEDWNDASYCLNVQGIPSGVEGLRKAAVWVDTCGNGAVTLCTIPVAWQEVTPDG